jgi:hypothetical protein
MDLIAGAACWTLQLLHRLTRLDLAWIELAVNIIDNLSVDRVWILGWKLARGATGNLGTISSRLLYHDYPTWHLPHFLPCLSCRPGLEIPWNSISRNCFIVLLHSYATYAGKRAIGAPFLYAFLLDMPFPSKRVSDF